MALDCKKKTSPNRTDHKLGKRDGVPQKERPTGGQKEREWEGGCSALWKRRIIKSLIDVANVLTGEYHWTVHCVRSSEWSTYHLHCISYQCISGWQHLQKPSPKCHFTYLFLFFSICISLWSSSQDSADCWSAHRSPAARDSFKRVHDWCMAGWRRPRPGGPPKRQSWLR